MFGLIQNGVLWEVGTNRNVWLSDAHVVDLAPYPDAQPGWLLGPNDSVMPAPVVEPKPAAVLSVTSAQAKIWLHRSKHYDEAKAAADSDPEVAIWWTDARIWDRDNPHVIAVAAVLNLNSKALDTAFAEAALISV
jgi:hypothetical protein